MTTSSQRGVLFVVSTIWAVFSAAVRRRTWPRTTRNVLARQILFTGVEAIGFMGIVAILLGAVVVVQAQLWLERVGQSGLIGPLLVAVVVRELGPLFANFIVLGRSGAAIASELAAMRISGEVDLLDELGIDPFHYLVVPRVLGVALSVCCLTVLFTGIALLSGYLVSMLVGVGRAQLMLFLNDIMGALRPIDVLSVAAKALLPGLATGALCCVEGLRIAPEPAEIPRAASRAVMRSVAWLFVISALISFVTF